MSDFPDLVFRKQVTLTSAQILALNTIPVQILPPISSGLRYVLLAAHYHYVPNTTGYTAAGITLNCEYANNAQAIISANSGGLITTNLEQEATLLPSLQKNLNPTTEGQAINLQASGNPTLGDGSLIVTLWYLILPAWP